MADILRAAGNKAKDVLSVYNRSNGTEKTNGTERSNTTEKTRRGGNSSLGKDDFLQILVAQLANQNPMDPMNDKEFIAQMAQFTAVEQMSYMAEEMYYLRQSMASASTLIGKHISYLTVNEKQEIVTKQGVVDAVIMKNGMAHVVIGKEEIPIDHISRVGDSPAPEQKPEEPDKPGETKPDEPDKPEEESPGADGA